MRSVRAIALHTLRLPGRRFHTQASSSPLIPAPSLPILSHKVVGSRIWKLTRTRTSRHRLSHVPLTLFYSSLTKLFLLFCLSIWRPDGARDLHDGGEELPVPHPNATVFSHPLIVSALSLLDEDTLDREWVVRNVLGGMAAGFGLRGADFFRRVHFCDADRSTDVGTSSSGP